jgi:hypothetical protein
MTNEEFLDQLKAPEDKEQEFLDASTSFVATREPPPPPAEETEKQAFDLKSKIPALMLAAGAAAVGGGTMYATSRKRKDGTSIDEEGTTQASDYLNKHTTPESGFVKNVAKNSANFAKDMAQTFKAHPGKASAIAALLSSAVGYKLAPKFFGAKGK